jgi:hypothetical protein
MPNIENGSGNKTKLGAFRCMAGELKKIDMLMCKFQELGKII